MENDELDLLKKQIRKAWLDDVLYFSVVDVIEVLTESNDARTYWKVLKNRLSEEGSELVTKCNQLKMIAKDGKLRKTDVLDTKGILRLVQSVPSPNAEPFKQWLAQLGKERIEEIQNPELAFDRARELYKKQGRDDNWIDGRLKNKAIRDELTKEWKDRGAKNNLDYAILTNEISEATFGLKVNEYKELKGLSKPYQNLRDHMSTLELALVTLGEATTAELHRVRDSQGMKLLKEDAKDGGDIANNARKNIEEKTGKKVVNKNNYLK
ncbi:MAG: hypothetical protein A2Y24_03630 [Clostridiales bacterium GWE2_32_10]|nr:MAG: hypothetical protein A2Y24_03630 [Clostridiales bacterium GWE2_32_10]HBY19503.1 hypothetical protein [Clostridiales bacterium]